MVADGWSAQLPMVLSLTFVFALLGFFTQYIHPLSSVWAAMSWRPIGSIVPTITGQEAEIDFLFQAPLMSGVMLQSAVLVGFVLLAVRRARLPFGAMSALVGLTTIMMVVMRTRYVADLQLPLVVGGLIAGVLADVLLWRLRPAPDRRPAMYLLAALLPVVVYATYFGTLLVAGGMWWTIHLWAGAIALAGVVGLLMAVLALQQAAPAVAVTSVTGRAPLAPDRLAAGTSGR
jgi:hypothetical protein